MRWHDSTRCGAATRCGAREPEECRSILASRSATTRSGPSWQLAAGVEEDGRREVSLSAGRGGRPGSLATADAAVMTRDAVYELAPKNTLQGIAEIRAPVSRLDGLLNAWQG